MSSIYVNACFKFGKREYMERLTHDGEVYMNTLTYFRTLDSSAAGADRHEASTRCVQATGARLEREDDDGTFQPIATIRGPIVYSADDMNNLNVFSLYGLVGASSIDRRVIGFGDTFVVFSQIEEFLRRVRTELSRLGYSFDARAVEYVSRERHNGLMGPFTKFSDLSWQSEVRIVSRTRRRTALLLRLGNLSDIAVLGESMHATDYLNSAIGQGEVSNSPV